MNVIGYIRVSRVGGREGDSFISPDQQKASIEALATREGFKIVDWYEELDASGGDNSRPLWNKALRKIERGEVQGLAVWNISRFSRSTVDALNALERIEAAGGLLYSASGDVGDTTPTGKLTRTIFLGMAQMERERARDGFAAAQASAIARGVYTASKVPTGYTRNPASRKLEPNEMAPVIREMFEMRAKGSTWTELARHLIAKGGSPKTTAQTVSDMLHNPSYLGYSRHGLAVNKNAHPAIVSRRLFDAVQAKQVARKHTGRAAAESLLGGIVRCDNCGYAMFVTSNGRGGLSYSCKRIQCDKRASVRVEDLDSDVLHRVFTFLEIAGGEVQEYLMHDEPQTNSDLAETKKAFDDATYLLGKFEQGKREYLKALTPEEFATELAELRADVQEARLAHEHAQMDEGPRSTFTDFRATWDDWTHESRKEWLATFLDRIVVTSAGRKRIPVAERTVVVLSGRGDEMILRADGHPVFVDGSGTSPFDPIDLEELEEGAA